jgi:hypothetical protein
VHHHLLGQVVGAAKNSNNQPSPLKQNSTSSFTKIAREYKLPYFSMFIKDQTTTSTQLLSKNRPLNISINAPLSSSATFSSTLLQHSPLEQSYFNRIMELAIL